MTDSPNAWLDETDYAILADLRALHERLDPPPDDLAERVRFAIDLDRLDFEVATLQDDLLVGSGARGTERARTITFDSDRLSIMVTIVEDRPGVVRVDGWLAPPAALRVELRCATVPESPPLPDAAAGADAAGEAGAAIADAVGAGGSAPADSAARTATADETGRFVFHDVLPGLAQLIVHPGAEGGASVVTPAVLL